MIGGAKAPGSAAGQRRVLVLVASPFIAGPIPKITPLLVSALTKAGCDVATHPWSSREEGEPVLRKLRDRGVDLMRIVGLVRRSRPAVVLATTSHDSRAMLRDLPLVLAMRLLGCPCVLHFHGSAPNVLSERGHWLFKVASRLLVRLSGTVLLLSSEECRLWRAFEPRPLYCLVVNPYVAHCYVHEAALDVVHPRDGDEGRPLVILFVGRLIAAKGILDLVEAVRRVESKGILYRLVFVGDGEDRDALERLIRAKRLQGNVALRGRLTGPDLARAYMDADVFALPSYGEGFPTVLAEAMDAGLPIVTTGIRGALDHLVDGKNALFVPPGRVDLLAEALSRVLLDADLRRVMAAANREKVKEFAPDVVAREYMRILSSVLKTAAPAGN